MNISDWIAIVDTLIALIGIIVGVIGAKEIKAANELKVQVKELKAQIEKIEITNSQVATTINNHGIGIKDTEMISERIVNEKIAQQPQIYYGTEKPSEQLGKDGDMYIKIEDL